MEENTKNRLTFEERLLLLCAYNVECATSPKSDLPVLSELKRRKLVKVTADTEDGRLHFSLTSAGRIKLLESLLAEVLADLTFYEPGNAWRLHSVKHSSLALTGDTYGYDGSLVLKARAQDGTTGGRFQL
jgi:hypothetical protein